MAENKVSLKIMVDTKADKVVFAEADKDFVDFIFQIMSLPLATVVKHLNEKGMWGCLGDVYKSIEYFKTQYFVANLNKDSVLLPRTAVSVPLLSINDTPTSSKFYKCVNHSYVANSRGASCPSCNCQMLTELSYIVPKNIATLSSATQGYVKRDVAYMVLDNLEVKPLSVTAIKSQVKNFDCLVEGEVQVGVEEGLAILKASMETKHVLTTVFLAKKA